MPDAPTTSTLVVVVDPVNVPPVPALTDPPSVTGAIESCVLVPELVIVLTIVNVPPACNAVTPPVEAASE